MAKATCLTEDQTALKTRKMMEDGNDDNLRLFLKDGELYIDRPAPLSKEDKAEIIKEMVKSNTPFCRVPRSLLSFMTPEIFSKESTLENSDPTFDSGRKKRKTSPIREGDANPDKDIVLKALSLQERNKNNEVGSIIGDLVNELIRVGSVIGGTAGAQSIPAVEIQPAGNATSSKVDTGTETPIWWDFGATVTLSQQDAPAKKVKKARKSKPTESTSESAQTMEVDGPEDTNTSGDTNDKVTWSTVVRKKTKKSTTEEQTGQKHDAKSVAANGPAKPRAPRSAAVLVKVADGSTYDDTVRQVRQCGVDPESLGAKISGMRRTKNGDLLVDLGKSKASRAALEPLRKALVEKLGSQVGPVTKLGAFLEIEVVDIDSVADKEEVLHALQGALAECNKDDDTALASIPEITVTGLWGLRSGQQVATLRVPRTITKGIAHVKIGWTVCRVRPKRPDPTRCFRCHSFGHTTVNCQGPDMSGSCRKCGVFGHKEKECTEDKCVACERAGHEVMPHRPGSGACAARRAAESWRTASQRKD